MFGLIWFYSCISKALQTPECCEKPLTHGVGSLMHCVVSLRFCCLRLRLSASWHRYTCSAAGQPHTKWVHSNCTLYHKRSLMSRVPVECISALCCTLCYLHTRTSWFDCQDECFPDFNQTQKCTAVFFCLFFLWCAAQNECWLSEVVFQRRRLSARRQNAASDPLQTIICSCRQWKWQHVLSPVICVWY